MRNRVWEGEGCGLERINEKGKGRFLPSRCGTPDGIVEGVLEGVLLGVRLGPLIKQKQMERLFCATLSRLLCYSSKMKIFFRNSSWFSSKDSIKATNNLTMTKEYNWFQKNMLWLWILIYRNSQGTYSTASIFKTLEKTTISIDEKAAQVIFHLQNYSFSKIADK